MNEPKKIWYSFEYEKRIIAGANEEDTLYIRADLVDGLAKAMNAMLTHMGMDEDEWNKVTFDQARAALKALEEE